MLIETNHALQQPEAAKGVLKLGEQLGLVEDNDLEIKEKSQEWEELLSRIKAQNITRHNKIEFQNKRLNCYSKLMLWEELSDQVSEIWQGYNDERDAQQRDLIRV